MPVEHLGGGLLQHGFREHRRAGAEIEDGHLIVSSLSQDWRVGARSISPLAGHHWGINYCDCRNVLISQGSIIGRNLTCP